MRRVLITSVPFGVANRAPLDILVRAGFECAINPYGRRLTEDELTALVPEADGLVAGTEPITGRVLEAATKLQLISRVGSGQRRSSRRAHP